MRIERIVFEQGELVEVRVGDDVFSGARVPLEALPKAERTWLARLAAKAQDGDEGAAALLLEAVQGSLILDEGGRALRKAGHGESPA
jgi:hypothetical protein